jgi:hypothetical protein
MDCGKRPIKLESPLGELETALRLSNDPIGFMCQAYGLAASAREELDARLAQNLIERVPARFMPSANAKVQEGIDKTAANCKQYYNALQYTRIMQMTKY